MRALPLPLLFVVSALAFGQSNPPAASPIWQMQESGTTAGLRGIDSVDGTVAWASGTGGTVLKTLDGGAHWTQCAIPDAAKDGATLDFRGVQAWDAKTAIVMSSGKGNLSRLYKTTDGCLRWKLLLYNTEKEGFWAALYFEARGDGKGLGDTGWLLGNPVYGMFWLMRSIDSGKHWVKQNNKMLYLKPGAQGACVASNSAFIANGGFAAFGSGGTGCANVSTMTLRTICEGYCSAQEMNLDGRKNWWVSEKGLRGLNTDSSGVFSIGARSQYAGDTLLQQVVVVVGGDYSNANETGNSASFRRSAWDTWTASTTPPHGFRSAVQWSEALKAWITVGTNGSGVSRDDGKTWQPLDNGNWNALSLPFVVGPSGRIARINPVALPAAK
jgi:photosystem II stability/assembly factor-like uncharacterized protein